ncbi:thioredoxin family protein [Actinosynnema sp. NPDC020468]|uniref:TlpA family protein disulfide reductase n=1 Tax=Actinosynnema sp. NPDC020468 TaxID=3154488 RepID=UPI0033C3A16B
MTGVWAVVAVAVLVAAVGVVKKVRDGRVRAGREVALPEPVRALLDPAAPVTLVQLSTTFCTPCRQTKALLTDLAARTDGLRHVELDVTDRPEVATGLGVLRTPTTLALTPSGVELLRVGGVPKTGELIDALRSHLPRPNG